MRRLLILALLSMAVLSLSIVTAQQPAGENPLQVIDSEPLVGQELSLDSSIQLYFNRPVNCDTAQAAVSLEPAVAGRISCDDTSASLIFTPAEPLQRAASYTLTVSSALQAQDGAALAAPYRLELNTVGNLAVSEVLPAADSVGIETDAVITVIFNRPVVPLVAVEDMGDLPDPLTITPAAQGQGEWLNTSIYVFRPDPALAGGARYTVTVNEGLESVDGAVLPEPFSWTFQMVDPGLVSVLPEDLSSGAALDEEISVTFNQPMDQASVEAAFYLRPEGQDSGTLAGSFEWSEDGTTFSFRADEQFGFDVLYTAGFTPGMARAAAGGAALTGDLPWSFTTVPLPAIVGTDPFDGETEVDAYTGLNLFFASPMNEDTLADKITIDPEPWRDPDYYYYTYDNSYSISFPTEPSTDYTITIEPGMEDIYGNRIERRLVIRYSTAPYPPDVSLQVPGQIGFYNAYNEKTQFFLKHRNVSQLDFQLAAIDTQRFIGAVLQTSYDPASSLRPNQNQFLRRWTITPSVPENLYRYELLDLGASDPAAACPGAPPTRLKVGDSAIVITDPDPVRARATPPDGEIVTLLYKDYALSIIGGPVCSGNLLWWEVQLRDEATAWVAEGTNDEYFIDLKSAGQSTPVVVPAGTNGSEALAPGIYYLDVDAPELQEIDYDSSVHFLVVSTANLVLKSTLDSAVVWATDVNSGQPLAGAPIALYQQGAGQVGSGVTDENGLLRLELPPAVDLGVTRVAVLQTADQFGVSATDWSSGIEGYNFGVNTNFYPERYLVYLYTDRPIYSPGQPVYFRGVVRERDDVTYTPSGFETVPVIIYNELGEIIYEEDMRLTPFGTFSGQFDLDQDAGLGYYQINTTIPYTDRYLGGGGITFGVAEYRVPEFLVNVTPDRDQVARNDMINVVVDSRYFFGGVVSDAVVDYSINASLYNFAFDGPGFYDFIDFDYDSGPAEFYGGGGQQIASGTLTTDAEGKAIITVPAELEDATQSQVWTIEATVRDESGLTVSGRSDVIVHKGLLYVGGRPESYVSTEGEPANVEIIAVDWESEGLANQAIEIEVVERRWSSVQEEDESGRTTWTWEVEELPVTSGSVTTGDNGKALFTFTPPNGGIFKVKMKTRDSASNEIISATTLWVAGREYVSWRQQNSNRIDLIADQSDYNIGDTAEILITSPFQGTTEALITVERGDVLKVERVTMDSNSYVYRLPITEDYAPNMFVTVLLVKGVDENNPVAGFRMGMIQLGVDNERKEITISAAPDREQAGPRETVTYTIRTTDYKGDPVQAEVGAALTDLASLSIADPNSGPILSFFYGQQALSVRTATPLTINTDQVTQTILDTIKGGGGGGGEGGIFDIRQEFVDTPFWNATVITDASGEASISVLLPDNLTTWRLDLRAVTGGDDGLTLVGQNTVDLLSTKPLLIRPVTPRFAVVDDVITLAAIVNNNTGAEMPVEVFIEGTGFTLQGDAAQAFTIPAGARQRVEWPITVSNVGHLDLTFFANGGDGAYTDASKPPLGQGEERLLPVYKYEVPETVGTAGILREAGALTESIMLPRRFDVTQGSLDISLDPSLAAVTVDGLTYLENFPHQCIEQTVSRFLPNIMTYRALAQLNLTDEHLSNQLNTAVNFALQRLYAQQKVDGGWGWFVQDASNSLTTAYALIGLAEAKNSGFAVDDAIIQRAQNYLRTTFIVPGLDQPTWRLNRQVFTLYALARSGAPDVARSATMYENRARLDFYSKAFLALTLNIIDPNDSARTETLLSDLFNGAVVSATGTHWEEAERDYWNWNTDTRTTAIALGALVKLRPDSDLIPNVVRWLMVARRADAWETTQETAWAVMSLTDWMVVTGELNPSYDFSASFNGEGLAQASARPENVRDSLELQVAVSDMLKDQANSLVIGRTEGSGVLYYTAHLETYLSVPEVEPLNRGIIVDRRYTLPGSDTPITEARVGDLVQVRLTVIAPSDLHYAVIEDAIPAGTEGVNPQLATEQQIGTAPGLESSDPLAWGWGWWWFSNIEFRDEKVVLYSTYLPAGTYEYQYSIRAGLPGTYNVIPPVGYEFYLPEVYGRGAGSTFTVLPAE